MERHDLTGHPFEVTVGDVSLLGELRIPVRAKGVILFAQGSRDCRHSRASQHIARALGKAGFATVLIDLLTVDEEPIDQKMSQFRFDVDLLARRLVGATDWIARNPDTRQLAIGYFAAGVGAAAALVAAAHRPERVRAVVSRGGRPDLAALALASVQAPTLFVVGGNGALVSRLNQDALAQLRTTAHLAVVPGASHLCEEPAALDEVASLASDWFTRYLAATKAGKGRPRAIDFADAKGATAW